jgi:integrase
VKKAALRAGFNPKQFADHSLRSGLITAASDRGATTRSIMTQTRHKSAAMIDRYYRREDKFTDNAASYTGL